MTMAERLRMEKQSCKEFDLVAFMSMVEEFFKAHDYNTWLTIETWRDETIYKQFYNESYSKTSFIGIPAEYLTKAINALMDEGFYIYFKSHDNYKVSLMDSPCIEFGVNVWSKITNKFND